WRVAEVLLRQPHLLLAETRTRLLRWFWLPLVSPLYLPLRLLHRLLTLWLTCRLRLRLCFGLPPCGSDDPHHVSVLQEHHRDLLWHAEPNVKQRCPVEFGERGVHAPHGVV